jgi:hypothetical protein
MPQAAGSFTGSGRIASTLVPNRPTIPKSIRTTRLGLAAGCALLAGCGGDDPREPDRADQPPGLRLRVQTPARLDAAWALGDERLVVVPAASLPEAARTLLDRPNALAGSRTDDGLPVQVDIRTLAVKPGQSPASPATGRRGWMPNVGEWSVASDEEIQRASNSGPEGGVQADVMTARFAVLRLPQGTLGQGVWLGSAGADEGGVRLDVNWLPSSLTVSDGIDAGFWNTPISLESRASGEVAAALDAERKSPFRRWRARLALGLLRPSAEEVSPADAALAEDAFADPNLERIARQIEERWLVALGSLARADATLAARVRDSLTTTMVLEGTVVPAWPTDQQRLDDLLTRLLAPRADARTLTLAAQDFLRAHPPAAAWIADEASAFDGRSLSPVSLVGLANLGPLPAAATLTSGNALDDPEFHPIPARSSTSLAFLAPADAGDPLRRLTTRVGDWRATLLVPTRARRVEPPGLLIDPWRADRSLITWLGDEQTADDSYQPRIAATLIRAPAPDPKGRTPSEGWVLFVQSGPGVRGTLRIWLGPAGGGRTPITIDLTPKNNDALNTGATFSAAIPSEAAAFGRLLLGLDADLSSPTNDDQPTHWAWPNAMFPWQREPGRAALDLTAWGGA